MKKLIGDVCFVLFLFWACAADAQIVGTLPFQLQNGTTADATQVMADFNKILNDVNTNGAKNGVNTDITALNALVTPITPAQGGTTVYFASTSGGSANAQTVTTPTPVGFTLTVGKRITFLAGFTNTGATTLNVNATGATNVFRYTPAGPVALAGGEIIAGNYIEAVYDGTQYQLYTNANANIPGFGALTSLASAGTTDLGIISSRNVSITGTTTITAFGSSAITTFPVYKIKFAGVLTLTHNGTSLILPGAANITTAANDTADVQYLGSGNWQVTNYSKASGAATATAVPTIQRFTSGSGTYTTAANVRWIRIRLVGGGGSGANGAAAPGNGGAASTFSGGTLSAGGGPGGNNNSNTASASSASGGNVANIGGGLGSGGNSATNGGCPPGGNSVFGGGGGGGIAAGASGASNSGGGGGAVFSSAACGGSGTAGAYVEHIIGAPAASYTYAVGTGGAVVGAAGGGGSGIVIVEENY